MLSLYKVTTILLLCLFFSACNVSPYMSPYNQPRWAHSRMPSHGGKNAAVGCSTHINTHEQEKEARTVALHKLAEQMGGVIVEGKTLIAIEDKDGATTNSLKREIIIDTVKTTITAVPYDTWRDPSGNEFCVWMSTTSIGGVDWELLKKLAPILLHLL